MDPADDELVPRRIEHKQHDKEMPNADHKQSKCNYLVKLPVNLFVVYDQFP
jgi:hypothetical protein